MRELSVNRNDPCEVIRELISNGYDAQAKNLWLLPLIDLKGFVFVDDGIGVSSSQEIRGITPWQAFFSIGRSTKQFAEGVGYKCQGSKLCFAAGKFGIITRCRVDKTWRYKLIDNPKDTLTERYSVAPDETMVPWEVARDFFPSQLDARTDLALRQLDQAFFVDRLRNGGTLILVNKLEAEEFGSRFNTYGDSYLREYIRFRTKHGDIRLLCPDRTGFTDVAYRNFKTHPDFRADCKLHLWVTGDPSSASWKEVLPGFPYLQRPDDWQSLSSPARISRLGDGSFFGRNATSFDFNGRTYSLVLAIDGWKRVRDDNEYRALSRQRRAGSGFKLADQRGALICSAGVPIGPINEIFEEVLLLEYAQLAQAKAQNHYTLLINGPFELVTNRDNLAESARAIVLDKGFLRHLRAFLDETRQTSTVFQELVDRLNMEAGEQALDSEIKRHDRMLEVIGQRPRFLVRTAGALKDEYFLEPGPGQENLVAALSALFAYAVPLDSQYREQWSKLRTLTGGEGTDGLVVPLDCRSLDPDDFSSVEFKLLFSPSDEYNHALILTNRIVAWEVDTASKAKQVRDRFDWYGDWEMDKGTPAGRITRITHEKGKRHEADVEVICLKELIKASFDVEFLNPPPQKKRRSTSK
jgi:hypothetical protein